MSENPTTPNPDALEEAIAAFRRMPVPERPADDDLLARLTAGQETRTVPIPRPSARKVSLRAVISCVAAAAILLAFLGWFLFNPGDSVALAEVLRTAEQHRLVRYKQKQLTDPDHKGSVVPDRTVLADLRAFRIRSESRVRDRNLETVVVAIQNAATNRALVLNTDTDLSTGKAVVKVAVVEKMVRDDLKPLGGLKPYRPLLDHLRELEKHKDTTTAKDTLDGREVVKYRLEDDGQSLIVWVDPKTKLPVRMEYAATYPDGVRYRFAFTDFEWDPEVKDVEQLFSTEPPEGYAVRDTTREDR